MHPVMLAESGGVCIDETVCRKEVEAIIRKIKEGIVGIELESERPVVAEKKQDRETSRLEHKESITAENLKGLGKMIREGFE